MSTSQKSHELVFGYVRTNYHHNIPEAVNKICLLYLNEDFIISFRGNKMKQFLSSKPNEYVECSMKFDQDIKFTFLIIPKADNYGTRVGWLIESTSDVIDYAIVALQATCVDDNALHRGYKFFVQIDFEGDQKHFMQTMATISEIKDSQQLSFNFKILSMQIKYKDSNKMMYYPSLAATQLQQTCSLKWDVPTTMISNLKDHPYKVAYSGPIQNNLNVIFIPRREGYGHCLWGIRYATFPRDISKMKVNAKVKVEWLDDKYEKETETEVIQDDMWCIDASTLERDELQDKLSFECQCAIGELYDLKGEVVPKEKWADHNVMSDIVKI